MPSDVQVPVKALKWREAELPSRGGGKYTAEGYTIRRIEGLWLLDFAGEGRSTWRWVDLEAAQTAAQADFDARIRSALDGDALAKMIAEADADEGPQIAGYTCRGCRHFHSEYWREPDGEGGMDSGTSATCLLLGKHIASYYGSAPPPPEWCPKPRAEAATIRKGDNP